MIAALFRWGKRFFYAIVILVLVLTITIFTVAKTQVGFNWLLAAATKFEPNLAIGQAQGNLWDGIKLSDVSYHNSELGIESEVDSLSLRLDVTCLFQPAVCIDSVALSGANIRYQPTEPSDEKNTASEDSEAKSVIQLPIPVTIKSLAMQDVALDVMGNHVHWQSLTSGLMARGRAVTLRETQWKDITVKLAPSSEVTSHSAAASNQAVSGKLILPEVWIPLKVEVEPFTIDSLLLKDAKETTLFSAQSFSLQAAAFKHDVTIKQLSLASNYADVELQGKVDLQGDYPLTSKIEIISHLDALPEQNAKVELDGSLSSLKINTTLSQLIQASISAEVNLSENELPFSLSMQEGNVQWPLSGEPEYKAKVNTLRAEGSLSGFDLAIDANVSGQAIPDVHAKVSGQGDQYNVQLKQAVFSTLKGEISSPLAASWQDGLSVNSDISLANIQPGSFWPEVPGKVSGKLSVAAKQSVDGHLDVTLSKMVINGDVKSYPLDVHGSATFGYQPQSGDMALSIPSLTVAHGKNSIKAQGSLNKDWDMLLDIAIPNLAKSLPEGRGRVQGKVNVTGSMEKPNISGQLVSQNLAYGDLFSVQQLQLFAKLKGVPDIDGSVKLTAEGINAQGNVIDSAIVSLSGRELDHKLSLNVTQGDDSVELQAKGRFTRDKMQWVGKLTQADLHYQQQSVSLLSPVAIDADIEKQALTLGEHCWSALESDICLDKTAYLSKDVAHGALSIKGLSLENLSPWMDEDIDLKGEVNATLTANWQDAKPKLQLALSSAGGEVTEKITQPITLGWDDISLNLSVNDHDVNGNAAINLTDNGSIKLDYHLPDITDKSMPLTGRLVVNNVDSRFLSSWLSEYSELNAMLASDVAISGRLSEPKLNGEITVSNIKALGDITPVDITQGDVKLNLNGQQATLASTITTEDGTLKLSGDGQWSDLSQWQVNGKVFADKLNVVYAPMVKLNASPDLTIQVTPNEARINGDIKVLDGAITIDSLPESAVSVSSDQIIIRNKDSEPQISAQRQTSSTPFKVISNVSLTINPQVSISAFGLESQLQGQLAITQQDNAPFINGEINLLNGTYRSFGQDLIIKQGKILMNGPADKPYVDITAIRNPDNIEDDVTAGVKVTGLADNPQVSVYSDPTMAQANALSYLLRGRDLDSESGSNDMYASLIGLSLAQSGHIVGEIGQAFGVQDLQLDTAGSGDDSQVTVSGYVLPGLQVKYGVGIFNTLGEFTVRYKLMKDLYVEAVSGLTSTVDLLYQFEFD